MTTKLDSFKKKSREADARMHSTAFIPGARCGPASVVLLALLTSGCATVTQGARQNIAIDTPGVVAAECIVANAKGEVLATVATPGSVRLRSGKRPLNVACNHSGYEEARAEVKSTFNKRARLQGPPGLLVDAISGAMWRYPQVLNIAMRAADSPPDVELPAPPER
jgi:hypothetical protein